MKSTMTGPHSGGCLCGSIKYLIQPAAEPVYSVICHCDNCKKATGTHFVCNTIFQKEHFAITSGTPKAYRDGASDSGTHLYRHFCGDCGSNLFVTTPLVDGIVSVLSGTLDDAKVNWKPNKGVKQSSLCFIFQPLGCLIVLLTGKYRAVYRGKVSLAAGF
ncbi:Mss4-like protein [Phyllosticta citricarpa]